MDVFERMKQPIFFEGNRVWRVYLGGKLLGDFVGDPVEDSFYPEEWIASAVSAMNKDSEDPREGLSVIEGTDITLRELIDEHPSKMLGKAQDLGVLVKFLDSAIRLPVQVHPDHAFSRKYLNSEFGKAEMWIVLATREDACIHFGFREQMDEERLMQSVERSHENKEEMSSLLNRYPVKPGDVFFIPGKMVHAIGQGCLILEIQEPTDFTIQPEYWCGEYLLNESEMYLDLGKETALKCFNYDIYGDACEEMARKTPVVLWERDGVQKESVITEADTGCFSVGRYTIKNGKTTLEAAPAIYVVTKGEGKVEGQGYSRTVRQGEYFFLPYQAKGTFRAETTGELEIVECVPPAAD